jgi:1-acyl-sn-glycerol-3-phosphate acyltransferase
VETDIVGNARLKFASLWVSQVARVLADWALRVAAFAEWAALRHESALSAWHLATIVFIAPWILLAPLNGCLSNSLPRRWVLVGSAAFTLVVVALFPLTPFLWMACLGVVALGAAVYSPTRYAMLPAAACDTGVSLPRLNSWIEVGGAASILGGMMLGWHLGLLLGGYHGPREWQPLYAVLLGLNMLCAVAALPVSFPADVSRPEAPLAAMRDFFVDCGRIVREREALGTVLGLAAFQAIVTAGGGVLMARTLQAGFDHPAVVYETLLLVGGGSALGCAMAGVQKHPRRNLGLVAPAAVGLLLALAVTGGSLAEGAPLPWFPIFLLGFMGGLVNVPLRSAYLAAVPADARGNAMSVMNTAIYSLTSLLALLMYGLSQTNLLATESAQLGFLAALAALGALLAFALLFRATLENGFEAAIWPIYRIRAYGPGVRQLPARGPLLIVANHSSYTDPLWVGKIVPRFIHPMMTSVFYDLPIVRWWLVHVFRVIRVEASTYRREAPELAEAVAMLKRGECVVVFPEGMLRRTREQWLRPFGQGVWHILREVPQTPVAVLWIEGGFGSFFSYWNGPPTKNKRFDWWRHIDIGVSEVQPLPPSILVDHRTTRDYLQRVCLECRRYLDLDVPAEGKEKKDEEAGTDTPAAMS